MLHLTLDRKTTIYNDYLEEDIYNLLDKTFVIPKRFEFNLLRVGDKYLMRPDLISYDAYGDTLYSDVICKVNGLNPFEFNKDMIIILPAPECINSFHQQPQPLEQETDEAKNGLSSSTRMPVAKAAKSKRTANEAVIGDARFNIDPVNGVVIY